MIPYIGIVAVGGGANFILYVPLILHGFLESSPLFKQKLDANPNFPILSIGMIKNYILRGVQ